MTATTNYPWRSFVGQNIKGTPAMSALKVRHDLGVLKEHADVFGVQEFKWPWYWLSAAKILPRTSVEDWRSFPTSVKGAAHPIQGAQGIFWKHQIFTRTDSRVLMAHQGHAGISDDRWLRGACLRDLSSSMSCWYGSTHFVVGGDGPHDGAERKAMLAHDLNQLDVFLTNLVSTGLPIVFELDANIHVGTAAYGRLMEIIKKHRGATHGTLGVEYLFTINGRHSKIETAGKPWVIPTSELYTDHEGRGLTYRVVPA